MKTDFWLDFYPGQIGWPNRPHFVFPRVVRWRWSFGLFFRPSWIVRKQTWEAVPSSFQQKIIQSEVGKGGGDLTLALTTSIICFIKGFIRLKRASLLMGLNQSSGRLAVQARNNPLFLAPTLPSGNCVSLFCCGFFLSKPWLCFRTGWCE